jgi:precorrin-6Y C5,15-methyltransferase (decarboxylating)
MPHPGRSVDVGAGCGSVGIEWMRARTSRAGDRAGAQPGPPRNGGAQCRELGVPELDLRGRRRTASLSGLPAPDAVFLGGAFPKRRSLFHARHSIPAGGLSHMP